MARRPVGRRRGHVHSFPVVDSPSGSNVQAGCRKDLQIGRSCAGSAAQRYMSIAEQRSWEWIEPGERGHDAHPGRRHGPEGTRWLKIRRQFTKACVITNANGRDNEKEILDGLGQNRWVVERTHSLFVGSETLRTLFERKLDIYKGLLISCSDHKPAPRG